MTAFVTPSLAEQAEILHAFVKRISFSLEDALAVVEALKEFQESELPAALRRELAGHRVKLGHMQALQAVARVRGRRGLHDRQAVPAFRVQASATGGKGEKGIFPRFDDAARVLVDFFEEVVSIQNRPFSVRLTLNDRAVLCSLGVFGQPGTALALLGLENEAAREAWRSGMPTFLEALRRTVEESGVPGVLDGYLCARFGILGRKSCGELEVWDGGLRIGTGHELAAYTALLSQWTPEQLDQAVVADDTLRFTDWNLGLKFVLRETEPRLNLQERGLNSPETANLLKRARRFAQRPLMQDLLKSAHEVCVPVNSSVPEEVRINDEVLATLLEERKWTHGELASTLDIREADLTGKLPLALFVRLAGALGVGDLNKLVARIPREDWVEAGTPMVLQGMLDVTHDVRFVISEKFSAFEHDRVQEAASNLNASRKLMHMKPEVTAGDMDYAVYSVDADEFLAELSPVNCVVKAGIKPFFIQVENQETRVAGCRLVIAILPSNASFSY